MELLIPSVMIYDVYYDESPMRLPIRAFSLGEIGSKGQMAAIETQPNVGRDSQLHRNNKRMT